MFNSQSQSSKWSRDPEHSTMQYRVLAVENLKSQLSLVLTCSISDDTWLVSELWLADLLRVSNLEHYEMNFCSFLEIEQTIFAYCGFMCGLTELIVPEKIEQCKPNIRVSESQKCQKMEIEQPNSQVTKCFMPENLERVTVFTTKQGNHCLISVYNELVSGSRWPREILTSTDYNHYTYGTNNKHEMHSWSMVHVY